MSALEKLTNLCSEPEHYIDWIAQGKFDFIDKRESN